MNTTEKTKTRLEKLLEMYRSITELVNEEVRKHTRDREYQIAKMSLFEDYPRDQLAVYDENTVIEPGKHAQFFFGVEHTVPDSGVDGLPETFEKSFGVERPFAFQHLLIDDEDATHFNVEFIFGSVNSPFDVTDGVPGKRFAASANPRVTFKKNNVAVAGRPVWLGVKNVSDVPHVFRAQIIGKEVYLSNVQTEDESIFEIAGDFTK